MFFFFFKLKQESKQTKEEEDLHLQLFLEKHYLFIHLEPGLHLVIMPMPEKYFYIFKIPIRQY